MPGEADKIENKDRYVMPIQPKYIMGLQVQQVDMNVLAGDDPDWVFQSNVIAGAWSDNFIGHAGNGAAQKTAQAACTFVLNEDWKTIFVNADANDFHPAGSALTTGENSAVVSRLLGDYTTDLDGKPRVTNGRINAGCYQAQ